jgi:hypothetical protein
MDCNSESRFVLAARILRVWRQLHEFVLPQLINTQISRNTEEPGAKGPIGSQLTGASKDSKESFGGGVFGIGTIAEHAVCVAEDPLSVHLVEAPKGRSITLCEGDDPAFLRQ